jgi:hypothetical protein
LILDAFICNADLFLLLGDSTGHDSSPGATYETTQDSTFRVKPEQHLSPSHNPSGRSPAASDVIPRTTEQELRGMDPMQLHQFMIDNGFGYYADAALSMGVWGEDLLCSDQDDLVALGFGYKPHRRRLMALLKAICPRYEITDASVAEQAGGSTAFASEPCQVADRAASTDSRVSSKGSTAKAAESASLSSSRDDKLMRKSVTSLPSGGPTTELVRSKAAVSSGDRSVRASPPDAHSSEDPYSRAGGAAQPDAPPRRRSSDRAAARSSSDRDEDRAQPVPPPTAPAEAIVSERRDSRPRTAPVRRIPSRGESKIEKSVRLEQQEEEQVASRERGKEGSEQQRTFDWTRERSLLPRGQQAPGSESAHFDRAVAAEWGDEVFILSPHSAIEEAVPIAEVSYSSNGLDGVNIIPAERETVRRAADVSSQSKEPEQQASMVLGPHGHLEAPLPSSEPIPAVVIAAESVVGADERAEHHAECEASPTPEVERAAVVVVADSVADPAAVPAAPEAPAEDLVPYPSGIEDDVPQSASAQPEEAAREGLLEEEEEDHQAALLPAAAAAPSAAGLLAASSASAEPAEANEHDTVDSRDDAVAGNIADASITGSNDCDAQKFSAVHAARVLAVESVAAVAAAVAVDIAVAAIVSAEAAVPARDMYSAPAGHHAGPPSEHGPAAGVSELMPGGGFQEEVSLPPASEPAYDFSCLEGPGRTEGSGADTYREDFEATEAAIDFEGGDNNFEAAGSIDYGGEDFEAAGSTGQHEGGEEEPLVAERDAPERDDSLHGGIDYLDTFTLHESYADKVEDPKLKRALSEIKIRQYSFDGDEPEPLGTLMERTLSAVAGGLIQDGGGEAPSLKDSSLGDSYALTLQGSNSLALQDDESAPIITGRDALNKVADVNSDADGYTEEGYASRSMAESDYAPEYQDDFDSVRQSSRRSATNDEIENKQSKIPASKPTVDETAREAESARLAQVQAEEKAREAESARLAQVQAEEKAREAESARLAQVQAVEKAREAESASVAVGVSVTAGSLPNVVSSDWIPLKGSMGSMFYHKVLFSCLSYCGGLFGGNACCYVFRLLGS